MMFAPKEYAAMADAAAEPDIVFETPDGEDWQPF